VPLTRDHIGHDVRKIERARTFFFRVSEQPDPIEIGLSYETGDLVCRGIRFSRESEDEGSSHPCEWIE
jgi:hypothetical protein